MPEKLYKAKLSQYPDIDFQAPTIHQLLTLVLEYEPATSDLEKDFEAINTFIAMPTATITNPEGRILDKDGDWVPNSEAIDIE
jgi:hypothetical protein